MYTNSSVADRAIIPGTFKGVFLKKVAGSRPPPKLPRPAPFDIQYTGPGNPLMRCFMQKTLAGANKRSE